MSSFVKMSSPTSESIALTEKKMDMALDDIIKMSNNKSKKQRIPNKSQKFFDGTQNKSLKVRQYMDFRSSIRQGAFAQRRTTFQGNRFPMVSEAAKNAVGAPMRNRGFHRTGTANWNRPRVNAATNRQGNGLAKDFPMKPRFQQQQQPQQQRQLQKQQQKPRHQQQSFQQTMPRTLDSLFASMKEQRMQTFGHQSNGQNQRTWSVQQRQQQLGSGQRFRY